MKAPNLPGPEPSQTGALEGAQPRRLMLPCYLEEPGQLNAVQEPVDGPHTLLSAPSPVVDAYCWVFVNDLLCYCLGKDAPKDGQDILSTLQAPLTISQVAVELFHISQTDTL